MSDLESTYLKLLDFKNSRKNDLLELDQRVILENLNIPEEHLENYEIAKEFFRNRLRVRIDDNLIKNLNSDTISLIDWSVSEIYQALSPEKAKYEFPEFVKHMIVEENSFLPKEIKNFNSLHVFSLDNNFDHIKNIKNLTIMFSNKENIKINYIMDNISKLETIKISTQHIGKISLQKLEEVNIMVFSYAEEGINLPSLKTAKRIILNSDKIKLPSLEHASSIHINPKSPSFTVDLKSLSCVRNRIVIPQKFFSVFADQLSEQGKEFLLEKVQTKEEQKTTRN